MLKFRVLGVFLALIYSFFLNTINYRDGFFLRERSVRESQIRKLEQDTKDETVLREGTGEERSFTVQRGEPQPAIKEFSLEISQRKIDEVLLKNEKQWFYRGIALERNRVLRN